MTGLYYEYPEAGRKFQHGISRTVTEMDNVMFSCLTLNVQPLHIDAEFASKTAFGQPLVNSLFILGLLMGIASSDSMLGAIISSFGIRDVTFPKPVFYGDTIRAQTEIVTVLPSGSRPNVSIVEFEHVATKQTGEIVCRCTRTALMRRKVT